VAARMPELPGQAQKQWRRSDTPYLGKESHNDTKHDHFIVFVLSSQHKLVAAKHSKTATASTVCIDLDLSTHFELSRRMTTSWKSV
jgi:hypothetical protein